MVLFRKGVSGVLTQSKSHGLTHCTLSLGFNVTALESYHTRVTPEKNVFYRNFTKQLR